MYKSNGTLEIHQYRSYSMNPSIRTYKPNYFGHVGIMYVISTIQDSFVNVEGAVFSIFMHHAWCHKE